MRKRKIVSLFNENSNKEKLDYYLNTQWKMRMKDTVDLIKKEYGVKSEDSQIYKRITIRRGWL